MNNQAGTKIHYFFYYPIPQEKTGYQLMERYRVEME